MAELHVITCEPPAKGVIPLLEQLLEEAKAGELSAIAVSTIDREGYASSRWSTLSSFATMVGGVALLQGALIATFRYKNGL